MTATRSISKKLRRFQQLHWLETPSKLIPHGFWGVVSIISGLYLIFHSITGNLEPYMKSSSPSILILYSVSTVLNAVAGYHLTEKAWVETRSVFKQCAVLQVCLSYFVIRFSCHFSEALITPWSELETKNVGISANQVILFSVRFLDILFSFSSMICMLLFQQVAYDQREKSKAISIGISIGSMALMLLTVYPVQLVLFGHDWWNCIQDRYIAQNIAMTAYIYIPAAVTFSLILFCATLYQRGILSDIEFGAGSAIVVTICLLGTVLSQELHVPDISTQRIYLPCLEPEEGSLEASFLKALDFSFYARKLLGAVFGIEFENDLYSS